MLVSSVPEEVRKGGKRVGKRRNWPTVCGESKNRPGETRRRRQGWKHSFQILNAALYNRVLHDHSRRGVQLPCRQRALRGQFHRRLRSRRSIRHRGRHDRKASGCRNQCGKATCSKPSQAHGIWSRARIENAVGTTQLAFDGEQAWLEVLGLADPPHPVHFLWSHWALVQRVKSGCHVGG